MNGSEPAFPTTTSTVGRYGEQKHEVTHHGQPGMSTRLYIACKVLSGWSETDHRLCSDLCNSTRYTIRDRADYALAQADALIAACKEVPNG